MTIPDFFERKRNRSPISMITCSDSWSARIIADSPVDAILVGDSLAMTFHGYESTIYADPELMTLHTAAVRRGAPEAFIITDMPFLSVQKGRTSTMDSVDSLMKAGANAVKIEGCGTWLNEIQGIVESGVPVMGHLGLTPQSVHALGGYRVQGRGADAASALIREAGLLQDAGCFALVLECIPESLAESVSASLEIPVIGIGAGSGCDGQVLVLQDAMGFTTDVSPRFVRQFMDGAGQMKQALADYHRSVEARSFPSSRESYR